MCFLSNWHLLTNIFVKKKSLEKKYFNTIKTIAILAGSAVHEKLPMKVRLVVSCMTSLFRQKPLK